MFRSFGCSRILAKRHGAARRAMVLDNTRGSRLLRENHPFKMSPLNLQHHRQPLPSPLCRRCHRHHLRLHLHRHRRYRLSVVASKLTQPPVPRASLAQPPVSSTPHFYIHLNPSILNDGYFLRATVWIFILSSEGEKACIEHALTVCPLIFSHTVKGCYSDPFNRNQPFRFGA